MILTFAFILCLYSIVVGYSYIFKLLLNDWKNNDEILIFNSDFIYGIFFLSLISIFFNFFIPLVKIIYPISLLGFLIFIYIFLKKKLRINLLSLIMITSSLIFISHTNEVNYDSMLYHLQIIKHNTFFKSIFGVGHLEIRYGMNSTWHSLISLFNISYGEFKVLYIFNILLYAFIINEVFSINLNKKNPSKLYLSISIAYIFIYSFFHPDRNGTFLENLGSPEVDTIVALLFIFAFYLFISLYENKNTQTSQILILLCVLIVTIKLSHAAILLLLFWFIIKENIYKKYIKTFIVSSLFGVSWLFKGFIATGCFLFPFSFSCFNTSWSLSSKTVDHFKDIIISFNRTGPDRLRYNDFDHTINSNDWILPWFKNYFLQTEFLYISFLIIGLSVILLLFLYIKNKVLILDKNYFFLLIVSLISLILWFKAPEIRLGYGVIIGLVAITITILCMNINNNLFNPGLNKLIIIFPLLLVIYKNLNNISFFNDSFTRNFDTTGFKLIQNNDGVNIYRSNVPFCLDIIDFCTFKTNKVFTIKNEKYIYFLN